MDDLPSDAGEDIWLKGQDNNRIFARSWRPRGRPTALLVIIPGFNSHSGRYAAVARHLVSAGLVVWAVDLRGRGRSDGDRYYVGDFAEYVDDLAVVVERARAQDPGLRLFLLGHSAGGIVAGLFALKTSVVLSGIVFESTVFELPAPGFALATLRAVSHILPRARLVRLANKDFSRDARVVQSMTVDPLIMNEAQPTRTIAALVRGTMKLKKSAASIGLPVLILHGTADRAAKLSGSRQFHSAIGSQDKTLITYDGYAHDLLSDLGGEKVASDISNWLSSHL